MVVSSFHIALICIYIYICLSPLGPTKCRAWGGLWPYIYIYIYIIYMYTIVQQIMIVISVGPSKLSEWFWLSLRGGFFPWVFLDFWLGNPKIQTPFRRTQNPKKNLGNPKINLFDLNPKILFEKMDFWIFGWTILRNPRLHLLDSNPRKMDCWIFVSIFWPNLGAKQ